MPNQRRFSRIQFDSPAVFTVGNEIYSGKVLDISLKGVMLDLPVQAPRELLGQKGELDIGFQDNDMHIKMSVHCVHVELHSLGLESISIDIDSAGHLRRLVEVNLGSENLLNREMAALVEAYTRN